MTRKATVQQDENLGVENRCSRGKDMGSPIKVMKGKKRGIHREIVTLGGKKKQETAMRRKIKRKMNQQRGQAGFPTIRKEKRLFDFFS